MTTAVDYRPDDLVQLRARERPYHDSPETWWRVVASHEYGLDCVHEIPFEWKDGTRVVAFRWGVPVQAVLAHRPSS